jgi:hypothetical protein
MHYIDNDAIRVLKSINFIDSSLFSVTADIFGVCLNITAMLSSKLSQFGYSENSTDLRFEFTAVRNLNM